MKNFKNGDIVTYDGCLTTVAIYKELNPEPNDSGDVTYKCHIAMVGNGLYWGNLVMADDIRLATEDEKIKFFEFLNESTWKLKQELFNLKYKEDNYDIPGNEG